MPMDPTTLDTTSDTPPPQALDATPAWAGAVAGIVGAGAALGFGELVEGATESVPSLVVAVGELVADYTPGDVVAASIANLGSSQKTVLLTGITITSLVIGGVLGALATRGRGRITTAGFALFGLIGGWAVARNPFSPAFGSWVVALIAAALGLVVTFGLARLAARGAPELTTVQTTEPTEGTETEQASAAASPGDVAPPARRVAPRRAFFGWAGGGAAAALALVGIGRSLRGQSAAETARESITLRPAESSPTTTASTGTTSAAAAPTTTGTPQAGAGAEEAAAPPEPPVAEQLANLDTLDEINGLSTYVTPNNSFYRIDTALSVPQVDPGDWSLRFTGMVESPYELTFDEILAMDLNDYVITLSCVSNQVGGNLVGNAVWTGVPLSGLLDRAGVQPGATQVVGRSVDDWTAGFPTTVAHDGRNAILAVGMNGEPLPTRHGFPARLVVAGLYGYVSAVKWIEEIRLTTWEGFDGYWVPRGWSKEGPMKTQSRIDVPRSGDDPPTVGAPTPVAGVAWAPTRGISAVHVRIDEGEWMPCEIGEAVGDESWVQWVHTWTPEQSGSHVIQVRATDGNGDTQPEGPVSPRPNGAEGWHAITVSVSA